MFEEIGFNGRVSTYYTTSTQTCSFFLTKLKIGLLLYTNIAILKTQNYWQEMIT